MINLSDFFWKNEKAYAYKKLLEENSLPNECDAEDIPELVKDFFLNKYCEMHSLPGGYFVLGKTFFDDFYTEHYLLNPQGSECSIDGVALSELFSDGRVNTLGNKLYLDYGVVVIDMESPEWLSGSSELVSCERNEFVYENCCG